MDDARTFQASIIQATIGIASCPPRVQETEEADSEGQVDQTLTIEVIGFHSQSLSNSLGGRRAVAKLRSIRVLDRRPISGKAQGHEI